jgi:hypothetical protein
VRSQLLPRFSAVTERAERARKIAAIVRETECSAESATKTVAQATLAGDERRLRGVPCIARGVGGASPGTNPVAELLRKQPR